MAQLSGDQVATIGQDATFQNRIKSTLLLKAEYWKEFPTANRSDVNRRTQKRKQLSKAILSSNWVEMNFYRAAQYWIAYYQTSNPVLDGNQIPTYAEVFNNFDPTYDYFAKYLPNDENETEIDW